MKQGKELGVSRLGWAQGESDRSARIPLNRFVRALGASVGAAPLLYGLSGLLLKTLPSHSDAKVIDLIFYFVGIVCLFMQLVAFIVPCAALALVAVASAHVWCPHRAIVPAAGLVVAGAMFSTGSWLSGIYGLDPPYVPFFLGSAMQLVAMVTPLLALGWVVARFVRRPEHERRA